MKKIVAILLLLTAAAGHAESNKAAALPEVKIQKITDSIYVLIARRGGNIALSVGKDGAFLVDDHIKPMSEKLQQAISSITDKPVTFVANTHWHYDHSQGNEHFAGQGAVVFSHEKSRRRMLEPQLIELSGTHQQPYAYEGLPKVTFDHSMRLHINDDTVDIIYFGPAHTDGDAVVYFRNANVMHTGDILVRYGLPFIDTLNGGSVNGSIAALGEITKLTDNETIFIPGHGPVSNKSDLVEFRQMLIAIRDSVQRLIYQGKSLEEIIQENPAEGYLAMLVSPRDFLTDVYNELAETH